MNKIYSVENDTVDLLIFRHFKKTAGLVEKVTAINPHVLDFEILPINTVLSLPPNLNDETKNITISLW